MNLIKYLRACRTRVDKTLREILPPVDHVPQNLHKAMRYAVLNGGKRIRSSLVYLVGESMGAKEKILNDCSAAIELIHAFSLIHDDLPAIDNGELRRGKPSCHKVFGEATAILAGDALLALAFEELSHMQRHQLSPAINIQMIEIISRFIGSKGMAGGEVLDIEAVDQEISLKKLSQIYRWKTSYLICASTLLGGLAANCQQKTTLDNLEKFGIYLGLAFQIHDDIMDIESSTAIMGKNQGTDEQKGKSTFPRIVGLARAKTAQNRCVEKALLYLKKTGIVQPKLDELCEFSIARAY